MVCLGGIGLSNIEGFNRAKKEMQTEELAKDLYVQQRSVLAGVLSVIPFFGAYVDELTVQAFENYQNSKRQKFVDVVLSNTDLITSDKIKNESFIINIAKTIELVDRCASDDKVVYYGNLVRNGYFSLDKQIKNDDFDEYEAILTDLSDREIRYLVAFAEYARKHNRELSGNCLQEYYIEMTNKYPLVTPRVMLNRLQRTGFVRDEMVKVDSNAKDFAQVVLQLDSGEAYTLDSSYDDFEKIVLKAFDEGKRL